MPKKVTPAPANPDVSEKRPMSHGKALAGWKRCPKCKWWNKGIRRNVCEHCSVPFPKSFAVPKSKPAVKPDDKPAVKVSEVVEWVKQQGGIAKAYAVLEGVEQVEMLGGVGEVRQAVEWVKQVGGTSKAEAVLGRCEGVKELGGVYAVRTLMAQWEPIRKLPD